MSLTLFESSAGAFNLRRYPARQSEQLRAWHGADTLLVNAYLDLAETVRAQPLLAVNDEHGALSVALEPAALWSDSALSVIATEQNLQRNGRQPVPVIASTQPPGTGWGAVVMKVPKQLPYFQYQLAHLAAAMPPGSNLLASGMDKHLSPRVAALLEEYIGPTERHRGRLKARVFSATRDERPAASPPANSSYRCEALGGELTAMSNVFSRDRLDIGSRFLIEQMALLDPTESLIDLACGNGVIGLVARSKGLCERLAFCDESAMAIASVRANLKRQFPQLAEETVFHQGDGLCDYPYANADLVLTNPPFHANHVVEEYVGRRLLEQSAEHLNQGGRLCLVANRHLQYLPTLKRGFSKVDKLAENHKFIIWLARK